MTRIRYYFLFVISAACAGMCVSQNNSIVIDGAFIVMDGGNAAENINIVIDQPNPAGIVRLPSGGHIHSENQYNFVKWLSGATNGAYVFPMGIGGNFTDYIPFTFNKTSGTSSIGLSTWGTNTQNFPKPGITNVGAVTTMTGITDSISYAIDRFWDIQASPVTADLTFSYRGIENTTALPTNIVEAQHWNGASWDTPIPSGIAGVTTGIGTAGPFVGQTTFSPWVLTVNCTPVFTLTESNDTCGKERGRAVATDIYGVSPFTYSWSTGASDSLINDLPMGTYSLSVIDKNGCSKTEVVNILDLEIDCDEECFVDIPNAFSPNGDGQNDVLFVMGKCIKTLQFQIYDRWGNKIFETTNINRGWDGSYKDHTILNTGVFLYTLNATLDDSATISKSGNISLIK